MSFTDPIDGSPEVVNPKSPEELRKEELDKQKNEKVGGIVSEYFPDYSDDDFLNYVAQQEGVAVDKLDDEQRQMAANTKFNYAWTKDLIIKNFVSTNISEQELGTYIAESIAFEKDLAEFDPDKDRLDGRRFRLEGLTASSNTLEKLRFWRQLFENWKTTINSETDDNSKRGQITEFNQFMNEMNGRGMSPKPRERDQKEIIAQFETYKEIKQFLRELPDKFKNLPDNQNFVKEFQDSFFQLASKSHDPEQAKMYFELFKGCFDKDHETALKYMRVIKSYGRIHPLTKESMVGFETKLFPALEHKDPDVEALQIQSNRWGMQKGDFGIADFTVHAYAVEVNSKNINELLMALREIPTSNVGRLEQNRKDALSLAGTFGALRDFIHDQRPLVREIIQAMVKYYESHDDSELKPLLPKTGGYLAPQERQDKIYDLTNYDKEVKATVNGQETTNKVIDILKRLEENTKIIDETPPTVTDPELNKLLQDFQREDVKPTEVLQHALERVNFLLTTAIKKKVVGIEPSMILTITWLERQGFEALQNMTYEDQQSAYTKPWLQALIKFQELTASTQPFNEEEFDKFIKKVAHTKEPREAYRLVAKRTFKNVADLASVYGKTSKPHISGALWSGNVAHEFTALTDFKPATTTYGERHKKEQEVPLHLRNTGD